MRLAATFNRGAHLYLLQEAALGGDLYSAYNRRFLWGDEETVRFHTTCIVRALEHLHSRNFVYRDLKLENVVLDAHGYAKLCDFGLAKEMVTQTESETGKTFTICGTLEYMAPEVFAGEGYSFAADWYSCGVVLFYLMTSASPFAATDPATIQALSKAGIDALENAPHGPWFDVVRGLCHHDPEGRSPMLPGGAVSNLSEYAWFEDFDWHAHNSQEMTSPYVPGLEGPDDLSNCRAAGEEKPVAVEYVDPCNGWDHDFEDSLGVVVA